MREQSVAPPLSRVPTFHWVKSGLRSIPGKIPGGVSSLTAVAPHGGMPVQSLSFTFIQRDLHWMQMHTRHEKMSHLVQGLLKVRLCLPWIKRSDSRPDERQYIILRCQMIQRLFRPQVGRIRPGRERDWIRNEQRLVVQPSLDVISSDA